ncbi:MAG: TIGR00730 family Rossman fold protein [Bacteroidales bacterium]
MKRIAVYCGSSSGLNGTYREAAGIMGRALAGRGVEIIYGGAKVGLMGELADAALNAGGTVTGIIPHFLQTSEVAHNGLSRLIRVDSMHERKARMEEMSDGALALPGGFGTLDELFEMLTWGQLGLHVKPVGLLNTHGFFNNLGALLDHMVSEGFLKDVNRNLLLMDEDVDGLLDRMETYVAPKQPKWVFENGTWKPLQE